jgi:diguanylate cyclase (GGDEF)-like protein
MRSHRADPVARRRRAADAREHELTRRFGEALRGGDPKAAVGVAEEALSAGLDVAEVHSRLIEPAMQWIGDLWERDLISVSEEHLATAISHQVAARVFPRVLRAQPGSRERVMLAATQGEHHVLGLRLAADVLEGAGYDVLYLGADVPLPALLEACRVHHPAVLGLTVSMWLNVPTMIWEIEHLAKLEQPPAIMVGGRAADGAVERGLRTPVVSDCEHVIEIVERLIAAPRVGDPLAPGLASSVPSLSDARPVDTEALRTIPEAFSTTSLAAADLVRESARHAFAMEQLASHDALTGLFNRRALDDRFHAMSEQTPEQGAMLMIDVDRFKSINDGYGHEAGDQVLVAVARAILKSIRPGDFAARLGGDEFVILLPGTASNDAVVVAERIRTAVEGASSNPPVTVSIGAADFSASNRLTRHSVDQALYRAKESGRNRVVSVSQG